MWQDLLDSSNELFTVHKAWDFKVHGFDMQDIVKAKIQV